MENPVKVQVAVVRGENRRGAVAEAISLVSGNLSRRLTPTTLIIPHLSANQDPTASTHPDTVSATIDALLAGGAKSITIAAASARDDLNVLQRFEQLGYRSEVWGRPVSFVDLSEGPDDLPGLPAGQGSAASACRIPRLLALGHCLVSLAVAQCGEEPGVSPSLSNVLNVLPIVDRSRIEDGQAAPDRSPLSRIRARFSQKAWPDGGTISRELLNPARAIRPSLSVIDTFPGTKRSGPHGGRWARSRTVIAGCDPVAVDAVAAMVLGFGRRPVEYLNLAESMGIGIADPDRIEIVGDQPLRPSRVHADLLRMHWRSRRRWAARSRVRSR